MHIKNKIKLVPTFFLTKKLINSRCVSSVHYKMELKLKILLINKVSEECVQDQREKNYILRR